jgi:hypothetical protein
MTLCGAGTTGRHFWAQPTYSCTDWYLKPTFVPSPVRLHTCRSIQAFSSGREADPGLPFSPDDLMLVTHSPSSSALGRWGTCLPIPSSRSDESFRLFILSSPGHPYSLLML